MNDSTCNHWHVMLHCVRDAAHTLRNEVVYFEENIPLEDIIAEGMTAYSLPRPTVEDVLTRFCTGLLSDRAVYLRRDGTSSDHIVCFRFVATSRKFPQSQAYSRVCSRNGGSGARWSDLAREQVTRCQKKTHGLLVEATLGLCVLLRNPHDNESMSLVTLLFPGEKVMGLEKDMLSNAELEFRISDELNRVRYVPYGPVQHICKAVKADVLEACNGAVANHYRDKGWSMLFSEATRQPDGHFVAAILRFSNHLPLQCLDFLIPALDILVSPRHSRTFKKVCQQALGSRYFFFASTANDEAVVHYLILGVDSGSVSERYCVHIAASMILGSTIELIEVDGSTEGNEGYVSRQQELIECIVDIVLYATSLICEEDKSSFGSFHYHL